MAKTKSEIIEQEEVKKDEVIQNSEAGCDEEPKAEENDAQPSVEDVIEALLQKLDVIEHRLAVLEGEGKKADDELQPSSPSARRAALMAKIMSVSAPVAPVAEALPKKNREAAQDSDARCKALYKNFDEIVMRELRRSR